MAIISNKDSPELSNEPNPYFLIANKPGSMNYEILLPITFTILFLILLFLIYVVNTYCLNGTKPTSSSAPADTLCCFYKTDQGLPR